MQFLIDKHTLKAIYVIYNKDKWYFCKVVYPYFLSRTVKVKDRMMG